MTFCQTVYTNNNLALMLNFKSNEFINSNVNFFLPKFLSIHHDMCIKNFLETGEKKVLNTDFLTFAKNKDGFVIPIKQKIRMIPDLTSGLKFISNIVRLSTNSELLQPIPDLICNDIFFILLGLDYKILGVTENTALSIGIRYCNQTEKKFKDLSFENFISNFEQFKIYFENTKMNVYKY